MPAQVSKRGFSGALLLFLRFLYIVFAKGCLPRPDSAGNRIGRKSLGYREQADTVRRTTGLRHGLGNALLYLCQCLCDIA